MTKFTYIKHLFKLIFSKKKKWELQTGHTVERAFISGGENYYKLSDLFDTFTERGLDAYQVYEEVSMRIEVQTLKEFITKFKELLTANPINILETARILNFLEERVNFVIPPKELIWKMASVAYFDENESPYTYDTAYARKKMQKWKDNKDIDDFFLFQQLKALIPLPELSKETYAALQAVIQKTIDYQSKIISGNPSGKQDVHSSSNGFRSEPSIQ